MPLAKRRHASEWRARNRARAVDALIKMALRDPLGDKHFLADNFRSQCLCELMVRYGYLERADKEWTYRLTAAGRKAGGW